MLKLPTLIALCICLVYSNDETDVDKQLPLLESEVSSNLDAPSSLEPEISRNLDASPLLEPEIPRNHNEESSGTLYGVKGHYVEEQQKTKPCKKHKNRRFDKNDNKDTDIFESLPVTATLEQTDTANLGNKIVTSSIHGVNYNYDDKNGKMVTENKKLGSENCDCDKCIVEANKKILQFETLKLGDSNDFFIKADIDSKTSEIELADNSEAPIEAATDVKTDELEPLESSKTAVNDKEEGESALNYTRRNDIRSDNATLEINSDKLIRPCKKGLNSITRRKKCGRVTVLETPPTTPTTRRILPGLIENPTNQEFTDNKLYQDGPQANSDVELKSHQKQNNVPTSGNMESPSNRKLEENELYQDEPQVNRHSGEEAKGENRQNYFPNVHKVTNTYGIAEVHDMNIIENPPESSQVEDSLEKHLIEPTKGKRIYDMKDTEVMLLENSRVCYACNTLSDKTCWHPDRKTTVKYCKKGHDSCLTKSFKHKGATVIIRDCGSSCVFLPSGGEKYSTCSVCHKDLCNGSTTITTYNTALAVIVSIAVFINSH